MHVRRERMNLWRLIKSLNSIVALYAFSSLSNYPLSR